MILFWVTPSNAKVNIVFLGLSGDNAPSLETGLETLLREKITTIDNFSIADYLESQRYRKYIKFDDSPTVSTNNLNSLLQITGDSSLIIWGNIKNFQISNDRKTLIFSRIKGELTVGLHIYCQWLKKVLFVGNVDAVQYKGKKLSLKKVIEPVSVIDRSDLISLLQNEAANEFCRITEAVIRTTSTNDDYSVTNTDTQNREPSISDVFSIPSIEPAQIRSSLPVDTNKTLKK